MVVRLGFAGLADRSLDAEAVRRLVEDGVLREDGRFELVEGGLLERVRGDFAHDAVKADLTRLFVRSAPDAIRVAVASTVRFDCVNLLEPDIVVAREDSLVRSEEGFASYAAGGILLVVEIATGSLAYDRGRKAALYARFGVPEYWVIDANERVAWVHFDSTAEEYAEVVLIGRGGVLKPRATELSCLSIQLAAVE